MQPFILHLKNEILFEPIYVYFQLSNHYGIKPSFVHVQLVGLKNHSIPRQVGHASNIYY